MSFDFNPNVNLSNVQASHKPTDGGGGNTGYFQRGSEEEEATFTFKKESEYDSFNLTTSINEEESEDSFFDLVKKFFNRLFEKIKRFLKIK